MSAPARPASLPHRLGVVAMVVVWAAVLARTLGFADAGQWPGYLAGFTAFLAILLVVVLRRPASDPLVHVAFVVQAAIVLVLLAVDPQRDFITLLFVLLCYEAAVAFPALPRTVWVAALVALIGGSLVLQLGLVRGLALGLVSMAAGVVLSTYVVVTRELGAERAASERMVADLREAHARLQACSGQADELAAIEQRARVARDLEQSVTRTLGSVLEAGAAARELLAEPEKAASQLERLEQSATQALAQMRRVITELRPAQG